MATILLTSIIHGEWHQTSKGGPFAQKTRCKISSPTTTRSAGLPPPDLRLETSVSGSRVP